MRKLSILACFILLTSPLVITQANAATPKLGGACSKVGSFGDTPNIRYVCVKTGGKLVWQQWNKPSSTNNLGSNNSNGGSKTSSGLYLPTGKFKAPIPITLPVSQSQDPKAITFANMLDHIAEIPQAAWQKVQTLATTNKPVSIPHSIFVGPTTKLDIVGGTSRIQDILTKSARLWSGFSQMDFYGVYVYNGADEAVTEKKFSNDFKAKKYDQSRAENLAGPLRALAGNCQKQLSPGQFAGPLGDCTGGDSGSYFNSNSSFVHLGQTGTSQDFYVTGGGFVGHEYTHAVQAGQWNNSPFCGNPDGGEKICARSGMSNQGFSPCWLFEGIPNSVGVMVASGTADDYLKFRTTHLPYGHGPTTITDYSQPSVRDYLFNQSRATCYKDQKMYDLSYTIGALATEALVAMAGPQATMAVYALGAQGQDFPTAFKNVYGISWSDAATILSKVLAAEYATFGAPPR